MSCKIKSHQGDPPHRDTFDGLMAPPFTCLITGAKGSGKSVTGHSIANSFMVKGEKVEILTFRHVAEKNLLPKEMVKTNIMYPKLLPGHIIIFDETQLKQHARNSLSQTNIEFDKLATLSRQQDMSLIYITQETFRLDKNVFASCDIFIMKEPRLFATRMEREEFRSMFQAVKHNFTYHCPETDHRKAAWVVADEAGYEGWVSPIDPPPYWSEDLSNWTRK